MNLIPDNATIEEMQKQFETLQNLTGEQRLQIAFELSDKKRQKIVDDIKKEHPEFTKQQLRIETIRRCYGDKLADEVAAAKGWK
jgi:hypothetical protein